MAQTRVGIRNGALFNNNSTLWNGLLAYYKGDGTANDALGTYNGTLVNGATYGVGKIGQGFSLDGVNDYVNMGNVLDFNGLTPFSFSFWINPTNLSNKAFIGKWTGNRGYLFFLVDGKLRIALSNNVYTDLLRVETVSLLSLGMQNIVVTYDGSRTPSGIIITINNAILTHTTLNNTLVSSISTAANLTIGVAPSGLNYYGGISDEIGVWNRVLTVAEKTELYNSGAGKQYPN